MWEQSWVHFTRQEKRGKLNRVQRRVLTSRAVSTPESNETLWGRAKLSSKTSHEDMNVLHICFLAVLPSKVATDYTWPGNTGNGATRTQEPDFYFT